MIDELPDSEVLPVQVLGRDVDFRKVDIRESDPIGWALSMLEVELNADEAIEVYKAFCGRTDVPRGHEYIDLNSPIVCMTFKFSFSHHGGILLKTRVPGEAGHSELTILSSDGAAERGITLVGGRDAAAIGTW